MFKQQLPSAFEVWRQKYNQVTLAYIAGEAVEAYTFYELRALGFTLEETISKIRHLDELKRESVNGTINNVHAITFGATTTERGKLHPANGDGAATDDQPPS